MEESYAQIRDRYLARRKERDEKIEIIDREIAHYEKEIERIQYNWEHDDEIIAALSKEFRECTDLRLGDMPFLFFATGLQCARWLLQPKVSMKFEKIPQSERHDSQIDGANEFREGKRIAESNADGVIKSRKYPDKEKMFLKAVPYDVIMGTQAIYIPGVSEIGVNLSGVNHRSATMGHDPVLGYLFGTVNIMTNTVTFKNQGCKTYVVHMRKGSLKNQYIGNEEIGFIFKPGCALERAIESAREDIFRIPAAVTRQALHMQSDKYTKAGLPIPFVNPEKAQELLKKGWNSNELERLMKFTAKNAATVTLQMVVSELINVVIETLYILTHSEMDLKLAKVKVKKIIIYSNMISSTSNVIFASMSRNAEALDIGGIITTIYRLVTDSKFIEQVREEYIYGGYLKSLELKEFQL